MPIGTTPVITTAPAARMADLYRRYYRPEIATLVIVGDIDPRRSKRRSRPSSATGAGSAPPARRSPAAASTSRAAPPSAASSPRPSPTPPASPSYRPYADPADTIAERNHKIYPLDRRRRCSTAASNGWSSAPGRRCSAGRCRSTSWRTPRCRPAVSLTAKDNEWQAALAAAEQEVRRACSRLHRPRAQAKSMTNLDRLVRNHRRAGRARAATKSSPTSIVGTIDDDEFVTTPGVAA